MLDNRVKLLIKHNNYLAKWSSNFSTYYYNKDWFLLWILWACRDPYHWLR